MRIVYMFTSDGCAGAPNLVPCNLDVEATNHFTHPEGLPTEGFYWMFKRMVEEKIVDEVMIVIDSMHGPGSFKLCDGVYGCVIPHIDDLKPLLRPDDVIFARGGFKSWFPFLEQMQREKRWILFYRANTNRHSWPFWDVIFEDVAVETPFVDGQDRVYIDFRKPTNPELFFYRPQVKRVYDLCIGASHIHDKKGQWRVVDMLIAHKKLFGYDLRCIMPGRFYRGVQSNFLMEKVIANNLIVRFPGMMTRKEVAEYMNQSKVFIHLGAAGQNDRGVLESMACGCFQVLNSPPHHAPFTYQNSFVTKVVAGITDMDEIAIEVEGFLRYVRTQDHQLVADYFQDESDVEKVILPKMRKVFGIIGQSVVADRKMFAEAYCN